MTDTDEARRVAAGLTDAQRTMMLRRPGRYQDNGLDILALINAEVWGTCEGPNYAAVRRILTEQPNTGESA